MNLSFSTNRWESYGFDDFIRIAREYKFNGIEIHDIDAVKLRNEFQPERLSGVQLGLFNLAEGELRGVQIGAVNGAKETLCGVQIGLINNARDARGLQIGAVNLASHLEGVQIGLLNYAGDAAVPCLPFLNARF